MERIFDALKRYGVSMEINNVDPFMPDEYYFITNIKVVFKKGSYRRCQIIDYTELNRANFSVEDILYDMIVRFAREADELIKKGE